MEENRGLGWESSCDTVSSDNHNIDSDRSDSDSKTVAVASETVTTLRVVTVVGHGWKWLEWLEISEKCLEMA